jgi:hypothetical protein
MNELAEHHVPDGAGEAGTHTSETKSRLIYDKSASEATRELRDTSRRRRDAEVKLQQHLMEAKDHVPHHHDVDVSQGDEDPEATGKSPADESREKDPEGDAG